MTARIIGANVRRCYWSHVYVGYISKDELYTKARDTARYVYSANIPTILSNYSRPPLLPLPRSLLLLQSIHSAKGSREVLTKTVQDGGGDD